MPISRQGRVNPKWNPYITYLEEHGVRMEGHWVYWEDIEKAKVLICQKLQELCTKEFQFLAATDIRPGEEKNRLGLRFNVDPKSDAVKTFPKVFGLKPYCNGPWSDSFEDAKTGIIWNFSHGRGCVTFKFRKN
jgi:hypothetical protein